MTYCYVDHMAGTSFEVLAPCSVNSVRLNVGEPSKDTSFKIRYDENMIVTSVDFELGFFKFRDRVKMIQEGYRHTDEIDAIRQYMMIDSLRYPGNPDDVLATFIAKDTKAEQIWVRLEHIKGGKLVGTILNQPYSKNFGVNMGDSISLILIEGNTNHPTLIAETAEILASYGD